MRAEEQQTESSDLRRIRIHRDFWYPVARSRELRKGTALAVTFAGEPIVLARGESGTIFALEDRCAHRQVPLHLGVVKGEELQCGYHAWCYDRYGQLVRIPYPIDRSNIPAAARRVRAYPCCEAYGLIFIFPGMPALADATPLPDIPESSSPEFRTMHFSRTVNCHYTFMHENLMDMNHQFLHRHLMGSVQPVLLAYRGGETWVEAQYKFTGGKQHVGADLLVMGGTNDAERVEREYELMTVRSDYPYQGLTVLRSHSETVVIKLWAAYVPLDADERRNRSFGMLMIRRPKFPVLLTLAWPVIRYFAESVFTQDRLAVEAEQRAWNAQRGDRNQEVSPVLLQLRGVLRRCGRQGFSGNGQCARYGCGACGCQAPFVS